jgi:hypothetical protein
LLGFCRAHLLPGETKQVTVPLHLAALRRWDEAAHDYVLDAVPRTLLAGPASDRLPLSLPLLLA